MPGHAEATASSTSSATDHLDGLRTTIASETTLAASPFEFGAGTLMAVRRMTAVDASGQSSTDRLIRPAQYADSTQDDEQEEGDPDRHQDRSSLDPKHRERAVEEVFVRLISAGGRCSHGGKGFRVRESRRKPRLNQRNLEASSEPERRRCRRPHAGGHAALILTPGFGSRAVLMGP